MNAFMILFATLALVNLAIIVGVWEFVQHVRHMPPRRWLTSFVKANLEIRGTSWYFKPSGEAVPLHPPIDHALILLSPEDQERGAKDPEFAARLDTWVRAFPLSCSVIGCETPEVVLVPPWEGADPGDPLPPRKEVSSGR